MAIEHKDIPEAELHEPKGVSVATAGKAYVTDGAGSGVHKEIITPTNSQSNNLVLVGQSGGDPTWQILPIVTLGRIDLINASDTQILVGADIRLPASYSDITNIFSQAINLNGMTFDGTNHIVIPRTGVYKVSTWISLSSSSAGSPTIAMDLNVNGVAAAPGSAVVTSVNKNAGDVVELVGFGEGTFSVGDVIGLSFASDSATTLTFYDSVFTVQQIG